MLPKWLQLDGYQGVLVGLKARKVLGKGLRDWTYRRVAPAVAEGSLLFER